jgi:RNA polymerase sigma-70 factor (sigma-E family)
VSRPDALRVNESEVAFDHTRRWGVMRDRGVLTEIDLEAFCHIQHPRLVRLLSLHCGDAETARDLTQETLVKVCQHWKKVRRMDEPGAWVTRVAINLANSHFRRASVRRRLDTPPDPAVAQTESPDAMEGWMVRAAVSTLPERQRTALVLRYFEDMSVDQTAQVMGVSASAVKKLTARGVERLHELLDTDVEEPTTRGAHD